MAIRTYRDLYPTPDLWDNPEWFDRYADFSEQNDDNPGCCNAWHDETRYLCTREPKHSGPHIADTGEKVVLVWV